MLIKGHKEVVDVQALIDECQAFLSQLNEIDPMRSRRYEDIGMFVVEIQLKTASRVLPAARQLNIHNV
jgi:hypothetical protein